MLFMTLERSPLLTSDTVIVAQYTGERLSETHSNAPSTTNNQINNQ